MGERWIEKVAKGIRKKKETATPKENEGKKEETVTRESERKRERERERVFCASRGWQAITFAYKTKLAEILCHQGSWASL